MGEKIFISYKRIDKKKVLPIVEEIRKKTGINCWIDMEGIESGDQFERIIIRAIKGCDILVFMMSRNSIAPIIDTKTGLPDYDTQSWIEREVKFALDKKKRVIPISIDGTMVSDCDWLAFNCNGIDCIDYSNQDQRDKFFRDITRWLKNTITDVKESTDKGAKPEQKIEVRQKPKVEEKQTSQQSSLPTKTADSSSTLPYSYLAIVAVIVGLVIALAFGLWPKNSTVEPTIPQSSVFNDSAPSVADSPVLKESDVVPPVDNEKTKSNQNNIVASTLPASSKNAEHTSSTKTVSNEEVLPTIKGAPHDLDSIGTCYLFGKGVTKNQKQAVIYFRSAAQQGLASAQTHLGSCYYSGTGVNQNHQQAFEWFLKAAKQGDLTAQDNLGSCYLLGHGTTKNHIAAVEWYKKAAGKGNASAQAHLGSCYLYGQGVTADKDTAIYWYEKAAAQGNTTAKKNLEKLSTN